jgi:hypothetical protein
MDLNANTHKMKGTVYPQATQTDGHTDQKTDRQRVREWGEVEQNALMYFIRLNINIGHGVCL